MDSAVKQTITSGQYYIKKFYASEIHIGNNTIQTGPSSGSAHFVVMVVGPEYAPVPWFIEKKGNNAFTLKLDDGFACKIGDEDYVSTKPGGPEGVQEWDLRPVLNLGPDVYYIRSSKGQAWSVHGQLNPTEDIQVRLGELSGDTIGIPEGPSEEFLFSISPAE